MRIHAGAIKRRQNIIKLIIIPLLRELFLRVSLIIERGTNHPTNKDISIPPIGSRIFDDKKSNKLKKFLPTIFKSDNCPKDKAHKTQPTKDIRPLIDVAF